MPGDGQCGLAAVAVTALLLEVDDEKVFASQMATLCGQEQSAAMNRSIGDLLWRFYRNGQDDSMLQNHIHWNQLLLLMRSAMLEQMEKMDRSGQGPLPTKSERVQLKGKSAHLDHGCFLALSVLLDRPVLIHFTERDQPATKPFGQYSSNLSPIHVFHGPMNPDEKSLNTLQHYDGLLTDFACIIRPEWLNEQAQLSL